MRTVVKRTFAFCLVRFKSRSMIVLPHFSLSLLCVNYQIRQVRTAVYIVILFSNIILKYNKFSSSLVWLFLSYISFMYFVGKPSWVLVKKSPPNSQFLVPEVTHQYDVILGHHYNSSTLRSFLIG